MSDRLSVMLVEYRNKRKLSQDDMASLIGVSQQGYGNIERGTSLPRGRTIFRLSEATGFTVEELNAAKVAQYEWNMAQAMEVGEVPAPMTDAESISDLGLVLIAKLSNVLARGGLRPHQIAALDVMVDSYLVRRG